MPSEMPFPAEGNGLQPRYPELSLVDRRLCVTAFRQFCP